MLKRCCTCWIIVLAALMTNGQDTGSGKMAMIPAGVFAMGNGTEFGPSHKVKIDSFLLDKCEVTNGEYLKFCRETGSKLPEFYNTDIFRSGDKYSAYPVVGVNWYDAKKYAEWCGKRLPTEAEWEYAARGGLQGMDYPNGNEWIDNKPKQDPSGWQNFIEPVGNDIPNGYGLYNIAGNVWEWVSDYYSETYYKESEPENPKGPRSGSSRVIRSGSWHSGAMCKKVYYRKGLPGAWCDFGVGFRCAMDINKRVKQ